MPIVLTWVNCARTEKQHRPNNSQDTLSRLHTSYLRNDASGYTSNMADAGPIDTQLRRRAWGPSNSFISAPRTSHLGHPSHVIYSSLQSRYGPGYGVCSPIKSPLSVKFIWHHHPQMCHPPRSQASSAISPSSDPEFSTIALASSDSGNVG